MDYGTWPLHLVLYFMGFMDQVIDPFVEGSQVHHLNITWKWLSWRRCHCYSFSLDLTASPASVTGMDDLLAHENTSILVEIMQGF